MRTISWGRLDQLSDLTLWSDTILCEPSSLINSELRDVATAMWLNWRQLQRLILGIDFFILIFGVAISIAKGWDVT